MAKSLHLSGLERHSTISNLGHNLPRYLTLLVASTFVLYHAYIWIAPVRNGSLPSDFASKKHDFRWTDIAPSTSFGFQACYGEYECARLDVPLDWTAPKAEQSKNRAAIAIIRLPAKVPPTSPRFGGSILINPGGPGGSGVHMVATYGHSLQKIVDSGIAEDAGSLYFDIIGFDPRGVNNTIPSPSCFPDDTSRQFWTVSQEAVGLLASNETFPLVWSRNKALAESCSSKMSVDWDGIGKYMSTPQVATDMVAIIEALGEWREKQGQEACGLRKYRKEETSRVAQRIKWNKGDEKLLYMGFSYGTLLGATFATLYPDKVGRVLLDGVVDAEDYYGGTWLSNLADTDLIIGSFFRQCYEAGPIKCPLWSTDGIQGIRQRYHDLLDKLRADPLPVYAQGKYSADVITHSDAMNVVRQAVYQPYAWFPRLGRYFNLLANGNGSELATLKQDSRFSTCRSPTCLENPYADACYDKAAETFKAEMSAAILCTDGSADQLKMGPKDHFAKWHTLRKQSRALGDYWAEITMYCANWNVRPAWNFSYANATADTLVNTSYPLLFASTTRDPVTPLRNAQKMQKRFSRAGLVTLENDGHCSMMAPSLCQARTVSNYFQRGELPREGLTCMPDRWPFDDKQSTISVSDDLRELVRAMEHLSQAKILDRSAPLGIL